MSFNTDFSAQGKTVGKKLTATTATTIYTVPKVKALLVSASAAEISGNADTISLWITRGSTDYHIWKNRVVAANDTEILTGHELPIIEGDIVKAQATTANRIDVLLSIVEAQASS